MLLLAFASCCLLLLAAAQLEFKCKISSCFCLRLFAFFAWARACTMMKCGTHFELKLQLALWLTFTCFCLLLLAVSARFGLLLLAIDGCAFRSIATQVLFLGRYRTPCKLFRGRRTLTDGRGRTDADGWTRTDIRVRASASVRPQSA